MASNNRTPASVLNAPALTPVQISTQSGRNRVERRHMTVSLDGKRIRPGLGLGKTYTIPKAERRAATNVPYIAQSS